MGYHLSLGRFAQRDTARNAANVALYEYANGNPVRNVDPAGLAAISWTDAQVSYKAVGDLMSAARKAGYSRPGDLGAFVPSASVDNVSFKVECNDKDKQYYVVIDRVEMRTVTHILEEGAYLARTGGWSISKYEATAGLTNAQYFTQTVSGNYQATRLHEREHVDQWHRAGEKAAGEYAKGLKYGPYDTESIANDMLQKVGSVWTSLAKAMIGSRTAELFREQNKPGEGFGSDQCGENGAVQAERVYLKEWYEKQKGGAAKK